MSQKLDSVSPGAKSKPFNWSGFYAGVNAGATWAEWRVSSSVGCIDNDASGAFGCPVTTPAEVPGSTSGPAVNAAGTGKLSDRGFVGGAQAGYNLQTGGYVFGLEIDAGSFQLGASRTVTTANPPNVTVGTAFDTDWLFMVRSRVGLPVTPTLLLYATGGFALTNLGVSNSASSIGAANTHGLVTGRVLGAGAEWALDRNWSLRAEYLHLDFGTVTVNAPTTAPSLVNDFNTIGTTADLTAQIVRAGISYRF